MKLTLVLQNILKFAAALDESQQQESEAVRRLQMCQLETAALRGEVVESRNKQMQTARRLQDAEEEFEQVCSLCVSTHSGAHVCSVWASSRTGPMSLSHPSGYDICPGRLGSNIDRLSKQHPARLLLPYVLAASSIESATWV